MSNTNPTFYSDHHTPRRTDPPLVVLQKILGATIDGGGGGGSYDPSTADNLHGNGSPEGVVSAKIGQHYKDDLTETIYWKLTGDGTNTGWA